MIILIPMMGPNVTSIEEWMMSKSAAQKRWMGQVSAGISPLLDDWMLVQNTN